jgi:hypothetical protein
MAIQSLPYHYDSFLPIPHSLKMKKALTKKSHITKKKKKNNDSEPLTCSKNIPTYGCV